MDSITLARAVAAIRDTMAANKDNLTQLDQQNGDGDLGITMVQGYSAVARFLESNTEQDLGKVFMKCSTIFNEAAPSTLGTITSFVLMGMAKALRGKTEASLQDMVAAYEAGRRHPCGAFSGGLGGSRGERSDKGHEICAWSRGILWRQEYWHTRRWIGCWQADL